MFKGKVYFGGGLASSVRERRTVMVYDPKHNTYDTLPPYTYQFFSMAVVNNQLVLIGGGNLETKKRTNQLGVWNEQSMEWTHPLPPMTTACSSPSVVTHNNSWLIVIGGTSDDKNCLSRVEVLNTAMPNQWYNTAILPQPLRLALPVTIGNICYLLGGYTKPGGGAASTTVFSACLDDLIIHDDSYLAGASASAPPTPSAWHNIIPDTPSEITSALTFNGALLVVGLNATIYHFQPISKSWIKIGDLPTERRQCACTALSNEKFCTLGGEGVVSQQLDIASVE